MKKNTKKQIINISVVIVLTCIMVAILLNSGHELSLSNIKTFITNCNLSYIAIAFVCLIGFILFEALSLHLILKTLGYKPKFLSSIAYSTSDTYYSAITPSSSGGQPASAYYMVNDGISGGAAGFALIFNLIGYTSAILIIGSIALVIGFNTFLELTLFVKFLIIVGLCSQIILLIFFISCMRYDSLVKKTGGIVVTILNKIKIIKDKEKWLYKVDATVEKYKNCYNLLKQHKKTFIPVILYNVAQRASQIMISVFVCKSIIDCSFIEIFTIQSLVVLGYNCIPLPGGTGAFEFLYIKIYSLYLPTSFIILSMMCTRLISYYFSLLASGVYTIIYHIKQLRKKHSKKLDKNIMVSTI